MMCSIRHSHVLLAGCVTLAMASTSHAQAPAAPAADLTPFKAVYKLDFAPANETSPFTGGHGRLAIEINGSRCTEYRVVRTMTGTLNTQNGSLAVQSEATITEHPAASQLAVSFSERVNGKVTKQYSIVGRKNGDGSVTLTSRDLPGGKAELPKGTVLPMQHELMVNAAATAGRKSIAANVYNPEISMTTVEHTAHAFGAENKAALPAGHPANVDGLKTTPRHRVELIFRDQKTGKVRAQERMTRFTNGILTVSDTLTEQLKIKAAIASLTMLPQRPCS